MKIRNFNLLIMLIAAIGLAVGISACEEDEPTLGDPPSEADAKFTWAPSATNPNIIDFTASNPSLSAKWDFGNGATGDGTMVSSAYPFKGDYTVKLTVQNSGGSRSSTQVINIAQDDSSLVSNPIYDFLTGGINGPGMKTWHIDSTAQDHMGVGPAPGHPDFDGYRPKWWGAPPLDKVGGEMYDDRFTFYLTGFGFDQVTNGKVYVHTDHAGMAPFNDTTTAPVGDFIANFADQLGETWTLAESPTDTTLTISGDAMIGFWTGARVYKILEIDSNILRIVSVDPVDPNRLWYHILRPEGYNPNPVPKYSLPVDFEAIMPTLTSFGNNKDTIIANPHKTGINTSDHVLESTKGNEVWSGFYVNLDNPLNFSTQTSISVKIYAPTTDTLRLKLEEQGNTSNFVEKDVILTKANDWEEVSFDMTGTAADFDRLVLFPSYGVANGGVYYIDDIEQK